MAGVVADAAMANSQDGSYDALMTLVQESQEMGFPNVEPALTLRLQADRLADQLSSEPPSARLPPRRDHVRLATLLHEHVEHARARGRDPHRSGPTAKCTPSGERTVTPSITCS